jgi:hypothetical protein
MRSTRSAIRSASLAAIASGILGVGACDLNSGGTLGADGGAPVADAYAEALSDVGSDVAFAPDAKVDATDASLPFTPASLAGLEIWLRSDQGLILDGGSVLGWVDQSGKNEAARNASVGAFSPPTLVDAGFGPALNFDLNQGLQTGKWDGGVAVPVSVFVVAGKDPKPPTPAYLFDSLTYSAQLAVLVRPDNLLSQYAGTYGATTPGTVSKPMAVVAVFNGPSSFILRNTNHGDAGSASPGPTSYAAGFTIGNYAPNGYGLGGYIAEFAVYSRVLTDPEIGSLNTYASTRYGIVIQ